MIGYYAAREGFTSSKGKAGRSLESRAILGGVKAGGDNRTIHVIRAGKVGVTFAWY